MGCFLAKSTRHLMGKIRALALIIIIVFGFGSATVFARGGGHSGGGDMEVATRAGMVVIQVATKDILGVKPAASMDGLQAAQRRGTIS